MLSRRDVLRGATSVGIASALGCVTPVRPHLIRDENEREGTMDWRLSKAGLDPATKYRCPRIEGYCSHTSIRAGETLDVYVSANPSSSFVLDLYRMGYYGGAGGRHLGRWGPIAGKLQPDPDVGPERLRECRWESSVKIRIPDDWPSGVYLGKLTEETDGFQSYVISIVRDDRACDFLLQASDLTWS